MARLILRYPDGAAGAGLLLMRLSCASAAYPALARPWPGWPAAAASTAITLVLVLGAGTRAVALLLALALAAGVPAARGELVLLFLGAAGGAGALALLGPGAYSIDAHRFGRRVIRVEPRSPDRGSAG